MTLFDCKVDLLRYGVKFSPIDMFNNIDNSFKMKYINKKPQINTSMQVFDVLEDKSKLPEEILIEKNGKRSLTKLRFNENSPLELKFIDGELCLFKDEIKIDVKVSMVKKRSVLEEPIPNEICQSGFKVGDYVSIVGLNRVTVLFFDGCYNWSCGRNCHFCDLHPRRVEDVTARPTLNTLHKFNSVEMWWESQKNSYIKALTYSLKRVIESFKDEEMFLFFMAGNLQSIEQVWKVATEILEQIFKEIDISKFGNYLNIAPHDSIDSLIKIKNFGIKNVQYNLEVANKELFAEYCPGKMNYDTFLAKLVEATKIMGKGRVRSNFVLGLQPVKELLDFADEYGEKGIVVDYSVFQPKKGTQLYTHPTISFDNVLEFSKELHKIYEKYSFVPIFSTVSSRSSVMNEMYEAAHE